MVSCRTIISSQNTKASISRWTKGRHGLWPWNSLIASQAIPLLSCWLQRINNTSGVPMVRPSQRQYSKDRCHPPGWSIYCDSHTLLWHWHSSEHLEPMGKFEKIPTYYHIHDPFEDCMLSIPATLGTRSSKLPEPQKRILLPADIFCSSIPGTGRQEKSTTCHRYLTDQHDAKQGPMGLLDTEAFLSPIPHRQDSSLHEFLLIPKGRIIANQRRSSNETTKIKGLERLVNIRR